MTNRQYDEVAALANDLHINLNICPTCKASPVEVAPGVYQWPISHYRLMGEQHNCDCEYQTNLQRHYLLAQIPKDYWPLSDDEFFGDLDALAKKNEYLAHWDDFKQFGLGIEFFSPTQGTGKTMLACLIGKDLIQRGESVQYTRFRDIMGIYQEPFEVRDPKVRRLRHAPVLILDEVGLTISDAQRSFYAVEFEDLIRFRTAGNSVTIITTNLTPDKLEAQYPRTYSLLAAKQRRVEVSGEDVRNAGHQSLLLEELALNHEARPIK